MRALKFVVLFLLLAAGVVYFMGSRLPQSHEASRERVFSYSADRVYQAISTPKQYPRWRTGVQRVDLLPDSAGIKRFKEISLDGEVTYAIEENVPNQRFVTTIAEAGLPYGGSWTYELTPTGTGTSVRITENGEVYNPIFRFVSKYVMGHTRGIDRYLSDLDKRLTSGFTE
jgi:uncharacterized protein YndB with AHSA1/START domain